jgi:hypothetical protein
MTFVPRLLAALALLAGSLYAQMPNGTDPRGFVASADAAIAPEAVANLKALLEDRPELLTIMSPQDDVWTWLAIHFTNGGWIIRWSNEQTTLSHYLARHTYTTDWHPVIFIARKLGNGAPIAPEAQLSGLVFELLNATHEHEFYDLTSRAVRGDLTRDEFVLANAKIEFSVCRKTQEFYHDVWQPHVLRNHLSDGAGNWHLSVGNDFDKWIAYHREVSRDGYPDDVYGREYDAIMARQRAAEKSPAASASGTGK